MAENWKKKELKHVLELRDEMITNNINEKLIKKYLDEQYDRINKQYEDRVKKYHEKQQNKNNNNKKESELKRKKAIENLLKNKQVLEEKGANPDTIKKYMMKQYEEINRRYSANIEDKINLDNVNFID